MRCSVLVFPAGTEVGLEIYRSLTGKKGIELLGASSVKDMASLLYEEVFDLPFLLDPGIEQEVTALVEKVKPDFLIPAHDDAVTLFSEMEENGLLGSTRVIGSPAETCRVVRSKLKTYRVLENSIEVPVTIRHEDHVAQLGLNYPLFAKPDIGQGSRGATVIQTVEEARLALGRGDVVSELLPGEEFTVDCYNGLDGKLRFCGPRRRDSRSHGISIQTSLVGKEEFESIAEAIASVLELKGPWFFQVKRRRDNRLVLLEVASRIGGSSGVHRFNGVNFLLAAVFEWGGCAVQLNSNAQVRKSFRCLSEHNITVDLPEGVYIDLDDTLIVNGKVDWLLVGVLGELWNRGVWIDVLTRHGARHGESAMEYLTVVGFPMIMIRQIHDVSDNELKSEYVKEKFVSFIDDSYRERLDVSINTNAAVWDVEEFVRINHVGDK